MADNVLDSGAPSAKRPKLSSPALSVSASDGNGKYLNAFIYLDLHKNSKEFPGQWWKPLEFHTDSVMSVRALQLFIFGIISIFNVCMFYVNDWVKVVGL